VFEDGANGWNWRRRFGRLVVRERLTAEEVAALGKTRARPHWRCDCDFAAA
jgi:hypothetical protein